MTAVHTFPLLAWCVRMAQVVRMGSTRYFASAGGLLVSGMLHMSDGKLLVLLCKDADKPWLAVSFLQSIGSHSTAPTI